MPELTIKLKQHTPLIHFQHDQEGVTLRASEVKPKLDKYIIGKLKESGEYDEGIQKGWIKSKNGRDWLDYKMKIESNVEMTISFIENDKGRTYYPSFFANQNVSPDKLKKVVFPSSKNESNENVTEDLKITIFSKHDFLKKKINELKDGFFLTHNFGTRQTKGFGSFFPIDNEIKTVDDSRIRQFFRFTVSIPIENHNSERIYQKLDESLNYFYKTLRSGINIEPFYFKSLMFFYAISEEMYYDKRRIREHYHLFTDGKTGIYSNNSEDDKGEKYENNFCPNYNQNNARLYRDMLGLSSSQTWMKYHKAVISKESNDVDRFESPLLLKPLIAQKTKEGAEFIVLIVPSAIPDDYFNKAFTIKKNGNSHDALPIKTPSKDRFDLVKFLMFSLCKDKDGYQEALRQLEQKEYEQWKYIYISNSINYKRCKEKLSKKYPRNNISDSDVNKELEKEADKKIYKSKEISIVIKNIYQSICCPNSKSNDDSK